MIFGEAMRSQGYSSPAQGYEQEMEISLQEAYDGTSRQLQTNGRKLQVRIPAGVKTGSKVRVAGARHRMEAICISSSISLKIPVSKSTVMISLQRPRLMYLH